MKRNALWLGLEAAVSAVLSLAASFLIARIVGPSELGVGAAVTAVYVILWVVVNALFADALVQHPAPSHRMLSSAFWASCLVGCVAMVAQGASGWGLAAIMGDKRLIPMALALAASLPLVGAAGVIQGLLTKERAYRHLAMRTLVGQGFGAAAGVVAALAGSGAWAFVWQQGVTATGGALALLVVRGWRPALCMDLRSIRTLLSVGIPLTASTLVLIARYRIFAVLIGVTAGAAVLGQVHIAFRLVDTIRDLTFTALWRLMLPAFAEHQHDRRSMLAQVDHWLRRCIAVVFPLCLLMALGLTQIVALVMGPRWGSTGQMAMPLVAVMAWSVMTFPSGVALVAFGRARFALYGSLVSLVFSVAGVMVFRPADSWHAVMIWTISQLLVSPYNMWVNARALRVGILRPMTAGLGVTA